MERTVIELAHVTKVIKDSVILRDVCLKFCSGNVYGIEGTNGSGKTMLMRVIAGLIFPTEGEVLINGTRAEGKGGYSTEFGMLIENPAFLANNTGFENLKLLASIRRKVSDEEIRKCLLDVGLNPIDKRKYRKYSLGMKQRLGIAAAILEKPDVLILDEPINALDETGVELVRRIIAREKERGALVILSCHDKKFLESASDELYQMKAGILRTPIKKQEAE